MIYKRIGHVPKMLLYTLIPVLFVEDLISEELFVPVPTNSGANNFVQKLAAK